MNYLLDANTRSAYLRKPLGLVAQRLHAKAPTDLAMSAITMVELVRGAHLSLKAAENLVQVQSFAGRLTVLPFDMPTAEHAGRIDADLARYKGGQNVCVLRNCSVLRRATWPSPPSPLPCAGRTGAGWRAATG